MNDELSLLGFSCAKCQQPIVWLILFRYCFLAPILGSPNCIKVLHEHCADNASTFHLTLLYPKNYDITFIFVVPFWKCHHSCQRWYNITCGAYPSATHGNSVNLFWITRSVTMNLFYATLCLMIFVDVSLTITCQLMLF